MELTATCTNPSCTENGVAKLGESPPIEPDAEIMCGTCMQPCQVDHT